MIELRGPPDMPYGFAQYSCSGIVAVTATVFVGLGVMAGASCGGSASTGGIEGGSREGSSASGSPEDSSSGFSLSGSSSGGGSPGGPSSSGGGLSEAGPPFVPPPPTNPTAGIGPGCTWMNGVATLSPTECIAPLGEMCGDAGYQATCACPQGTCACLGASTSVVSFTGCPNCPTPEEAFTLCGFPHQ